MTISKTVFCAFLMGATAFVSPALSADRAADPAGAKTIADFIAAYAGKAAAPAIKVTADGSGYLVSFDIAAANAMLKGTGAVYDSASIKFRVVSQDDGQWRIERFTMPAISAHTPLPDGKGEVRARVEVENYNFTTLIDPKLGWIASSHGGADKISLTEHAPGLDLFIEMGKLRADLTTKSDAPGLTTTVSEPIGSFNMVMDITDAGKNSHVSGKGEGGGVDFAISRFQPGPITDLWRFVAAHPERADYARDFDALKTVVNAFLADRFTVDEGFKFDKISVTTEIGPVEIGGASFGAGAANAGADSGFSERFAAKSIKLPEGLVPAMYAPVTPSAFDIGFKASGFDLPAAAQEWFADAKLDGADPVLSKEASAKVSAKLVGAKPIVVDILPSHVVGPSLNIAFEGKITIDKTQPTGSVTIQVRDFDATAQAIQKLGPKAEQQLVPVIAMAKGLGKPGPDGAMVWVCDLGRDKIMKVNGLPLGKAPF